jgi:hypothetical protein
MNNDKEKIIWIESVAASFVNRKYRKELEENLPRARIDLMFEFDSVRDALTVGRNGLWVIEGDFPHRLTGLVERIKDAHPYANILVYHAGKPYDVPGVDEQFDRTIVTPPELARMLSKYLH